jgi:hypothetical protein
MGFISQLFQQRVKLSTMHVTLHTHRLVRDARHLAHCAADLHGQWHGQGQRGDEGRKT